MFAGATAVKAAGHDISLVRWLGSANRNKLKNRKKLQKPHNKIQKPHNKIQKPHNKLKIVDRKGLSEIPEVTQRLA